MRKLFVGFLVLFYLVILNAGPVNANNIDPADFMDNTEKYRGEQITLKGHISSAIFASDEESLWDYKGKIFELFVYGTRDNIKILIPEHLSDIPKAVYLDREVATFICKDGDPQNGNVAVSIARSHCEIPGSKTGNGGRENR